MTTRGAAKGDGAATPRGTTRFAERFARRAGARSASEAAASYAADFFRPLADGLHASSIGLGTYLGACDDEDDARYADAVAHAVARGVNLLDTAINYRCQRSERAVGEGVRRAIEAGAARRDELVVCTKGGYVALDGTPPASREEYQAYLQRRFFDAELMEPGDLVAGGHSLAPRFLADQIATSRANLGVGAIDVYYLHNPEQQLDAVQPARFRTIVRRAFTLLEEQADAGAIGCYGCATWHGLRAPPDAKHHLSLAELVSIAREVGGDGHRFRVVQMPLNLAMSEAARDATQRMSGGRTVPALQAAAELGLSVVASASLMQAQLAAGLPQPVRDAFPELATDAQRAIAFVRSLPGVQVALVGMRSAAHVEENLGAARAVAG